jgi:hypothetical protein
MRKARRILALAVALVMTVGMLPTSAFAAEPEEPQQGHVHTAECYAETLVCGLDEHTHGEDCYTITEAPAPEEDNSASDEPAGSDETTEPEPAPDASDDGDQGGDTEADADSGNEGGESDGNAEAESGSDSSVSSDSESSSAEDTTIADEPAPLAAEPTKELTCGLEEHTHGEDCYELTLICGLEEDEEAEAPEANGGAAVTEEPSEAVQAFLEAVAQLPETVDEENAEEIESLLQEALEMFGQLTAEEQEREDVMNAQAKTLSLWEQLEGVKAETLDVEGVARIGDQGYETLSEAIKAAKTDDEIILLEDIVETSKNVTFSADKLTLNLNGHTIKLEYPATSKGFIDVVEGRTLTIAGEGGFTGTSYSEHTKQYDINLKNGNLIIAEDAHIATIKVGTPSFTNKDKQEDVNYKAECTIDGVVDNLVVGQVTPHSKTYENVSLTNILEVNAPVETLTLGQSCAGTYRETLKNRAFINASVGTMTATQSGKTSELYLNSTVDTLNLSLNKNYSAEDDVPVTQVGPEFKASTWNVAKLNLVNFATSDIRNQYANPMQKMEDLILATGMDGHEITVDQVGNTSWMPSNGSSKLEYTDPESGIKADYKYLTQVEVINGQIVLHKTVLAGVPKVIYINGSNGSDANDGATTKTPIKTFARAKELLNANDLNTIYVMGTVTVSGNETWELGNDAGVSGTIKRYSSFKNALINIPKNANLTLGNIIIDGGRNENISASQPLVTVQADAALTLGQGAVLQNNTNTGSVRGGAINNKGKLTIEDGALIQKNTTVESGGGIYSTGSIEMNGGEISANSSTKWSGAQNKSTGGGVCIGPNGYMEMNDGLIAKNSTTGYLAFGGGIALGDAAAREGMKLVMNGGTIESNVCKGNGGGIAVWTGGEAEINGGNIINNSCNSNTTDWTLSYFGGGGIYVNKGATLTLKTVEVTNNKGLTGNGISACPTSDVRFYIKNGGVFYGNGSSIWISTTTGGSGKVPVSITNYTLNGYKYNWNNGEITTEDLNTVLGKEGIGLNSGLTMEQGKSAAEFCNVHITGNSSGTGGKAYPGGGIGCNGTLIIGEASNDLTLEKKVDGSAAPLDEQFDFTVAFKTSDGAPYTGSITVLRDGVESKMEPNEEGEVELSLVKDGYVVFHDLPVGVKYEITEGENQANKVTIDKIVVTDLENLDEYKDPNIEHTTTEDNKVSGETSETDKGLNEVVFTNTYDLAKLTIQKVVTGDSDNAKDKVYTIVVTGPSYPDGKEFSVTAEKPFELQDLQPGEYTVTEKGAEIDGFEWTVQITAALVEKSEDSGDADEGEETQPVQGVVNLPAAGEGTVVVTNNYKELPPNSLTISKKVVGENIGNRFDFVLKLNRYGNPVTDELQYAINGEETEEKLKANENGEYVFQLEGDQSITIFGIKHNTQYEVQENVDGDKYQTVYGKLDEEGQRVNIEAGSIYSDKGASVLVTNTRVTGNLSVSKTVENETTDKEFKFVVKLTDENDKPLTGKIGGLEFDEQGQAAFTLKHGETREIKGIPTATAEGKRTKYEVTEVEIDNDQYVVSYTKRTGDIIASTEETTAVTVSVVNARRLGSLSLTKKVVGTMTTEEFKLVLTLTNDGMPLTGQFGEYLFDEKGQATISLKADQSVVINGIPAGTQYKVEETAESSHGYVATYENAFGTITEKTIEVVVTNTKPEEPEAPKGNLSVSKTVTGNGGDRNREFTFVIELFDGETALSGAFAATGEAFVEGVEAPEIQELTFVDGKAELKLRHGQRVTIQGIPSGAAYKVTETEANQDGYTTTVAGAEGVIAENGNAAAAFVNDRTVRRPPDEPDEPDDPDEPDEPDEPNTPDEPDEDIPDDETPLTPGPGPDPDPEVPTPGVPKTPEEVIELEEPEVPLAKVPGEPEEPEEEIPDEDVPLADVPKTGDDSNAQVWLALALASLCGMALVARKSDENAR